MLLGVKKALKNREIAAIGAVTASRAEAGDLRRKSGKKFPLQGWDSGFVGEGVAVIHWDPGLERRCQLGSHPLGSCQLEHQQDMLGSWQGEQWACWENRPVR